MESLTDIELVEKEFRIYSLYLEGYSYKEIENITNHKIKVIDNALQRAKRKMINIRKEIEKRMVIS